VFATLFIMQIEVHPEDIKTCKVHVNKKGRGGKTYFVTMPIELARRYDLCNKDRIVIAFIKRLEDNGCLKKD
jgi:hypothetical protein